MDDFDSFGGFDAPGRSPSRSSGSTGKGGAGWHWLLTLVSLLLVSLFSFLMAYLTKDVPERPIWLMGLIFMVPVGAMFFSAMTLEFSLGAMTPAVSRASQLKVAVAATLATFVVACACDAIYLYGGFVGDSSDNLIFLVYEDDVSGNSSTDRAVMQVLDDLYRKSGSRVEAGLFLFDFGNQTGRGKNDTVVPLAPFNSAQLESMRRTLINGEKQESSAYGHDEAYAMVERSSSTRPTRIILIADSPIRYGDGTYTQTQWDRDVERLKRDKISLYFMGHGKPDKGMYYMAEHTSGKVITEYDANNVLENLRTFTRADGDMVRADTPSATMLTGIMLLLEGLTVGVGLMLLLSVRGQKRFQALLSPLLAVAAFLLLKVVHIDSLPQWVLEGIAFSLFGLVFMMRNNTSGSPSARPVTPVPAGPDSFPADDW